MPSYSIAWDRRYAECRRQPGRSPWLLEAILCVRTLIEGKPQLRIVTRLAVINEGHIGDTAAQDQFWHAVTAKAGKLRQLSARDRDQVLELVALKVPRPAPLPSASASTTRSYPVVAGPHSWLPPPWQRVRAR
jgi:hypothetical protein